MIEATKYKIPKIERISLREWTKGTFTANDEGRTPQNALRSSGNVILDQDGTIRPRKSLVQYGTQPTGTVLGEVFEYVRTTATGQQNYVICMQNVGGTTQPYIQSDGGAWVATTGKTYDNTAAAHFCQVDNKVLIMNGVDNLSYFDITTSETTPTITPFTALATPSAPTIANNGSTNLTTGTVPYTVYYAVSANSTVGETIGSTATSQTVTTERDAWVSTTQSLKISWSAVASAASYNVYYGVSPSQMFLIQSGLNSLSFVDDGTYAKDVTRLSPVSDSTQGPKTTRGTVINGQVFMTGDADNPHYIWFGGVTENTILDFSPFGSGGNVEIGRGSKEFPVKVMSFRDGRGLARITALCRSTNGMGKRYTLTRQQITSGSTFIDYMEVSEDNGEAGTDSPDGVLLYDDTLWYPSRDGFKTTGTKPQLQNILSTNRVSNTIQRDIAELNNNAMEQCVGLGFESKLYWSLPVGSDTNNQIWVLDLLQKGAWMKPWNISADWMWLYNDNDGVTHHCILSENKVLEFTYAEATNDDGVAFGTSATSGVIKFSEDGREWAKVLDVTFILQRPQGVINVSISGKTEEETLTTLGSTAYDPSTSISGWSETNWESYLGWADSETVPTSFGDALAEVKLEIDENMNWWKWNLNTIERGVDYQLSDIVMRFVRIGVLDVS